MHGAWKTGWFWLMVISVSLLIAMIFCYEFLGGTSGYVTYESTPVWIWWVAWTGLLILIISFVAFCYWVYQYHRRQKCQDIIGDSVIKIGDNIVIEPEHHDKDRCGEKPKKKEDSCADMICERLLEPRKRDCPRKKTCQTAPRFVRIKV